MAGSFSKDSIIWLFCRPNAMRILKTVMTSWIEIASNDGRWIRRREWKIKIQMFYFFPIISWHRDLKKKKNGFFKKIFVTGMNAVYFSRASLLIVVAWITWMDRMTRTLWSKLSRWWWGAPEVLHPRSFYMKRDVGNCSSRSITLYYYDFSSSNWI